MLSLHALTEIRDGSRGRGGLGAAPIQKSAPPVPPNEVHQADILTEIYAITSLGLQVQVCQLSTVPALHLPPWPLILIFLEPSLIEMNKYR